MKFLQERYLHDSLVRDMTLEEIFTIMEKTLIKMKIDLMEYRAVDYGKSIMVFSEFLEEFILCSNQQNELRKKRDFEREDYVTYMSNSKKFIAMAENRFNFSLQQALKF